MTRTTVQTAKSSGIFAEIFNFWRCSLIFLRKSSIERINLQRLFQFHENHKLSKGEGQQPFEPASSGRGAQGEDEYYDSETEAPPGKITRSPGRYVD